MTKKIGFIFPGQGSQYIGMGLDFYDNFSIFKQTFEECSDLLSVNISQLIFRGPGDELMLTKNSQIAIYVVGVGIYRVFKDLYSDITPSAVSGLSLGEYTALTASNRLSFEDGVKLVRLRGESMHAATLTHPGKMMVVLGMSPENVEKVLRAIDGVFIANLNCPGQVVISGEKNAVDKAFTVLSGSGAKKILPLDVSGAFHSPLMNDARSQLKEVIDNTKLYTGNAELVMNVTGSRVSKDEIKPNMVKQITSPVLWHKGIVEMDSNLVDYFVEIGPGKTLKGMNRKIKTSAPTYNIDKIEDMEKTASEVLHAIT